MPKGIKQLSADWKKNIGKAHIGIRQTPESIAKIKKNRKGKALGNKNCVGRIPWNKGKPYLAVRGEKNWKWKGGKSFEPYSIDWTETLKRSIRERDNYICQICSQYGNEVHHKNHDKKNCNPDNLITLCKKCHSKHHLTQ
jgi:hypothetical protein